MAGTTLIPNVLGNEPLKPGGRPRSPAILYPSVPVEARIRQDDYLPLRIPPVELAQREAQRLQPLGSMSTKTASSNMFTVLLGSAPAAVLISGNNSKNESIFPMRPKVGAKCAPMASMRGGDMPRFLSLSRRSRVR